MEILQHLVDNHNHAFYLVGGISLVVELAVLGLGGPLLFFGIAAFITGLLINVGLISGWEAEIFTLAVITAVIALVLWRPLKNFQNAGGGADTSSDMIGLTVPVAVDINSKVGGKIRYSAINWNARLAEDSGVEVIAAGESCTIAGVEGTTMLVKPQA